MAGWNKDAQNMNRGNLTSGNTSLNQNNVSTTILERVLSRDSIKKQGIRNQSQTENKNLMRLKQQQFQKRDNITIDTNEASLLQKSYISDEKILKLNGLAVTYAQGKGPMDKQ